MAAVANSMFQPTFDTGNSTSEQTLRTGNIFTSRSDIGIQTKNNTDDPLRPSAASKKSFAQSAESISTLSASTFNSSKKNSSVADSKDLTDSWDIVNFPTNSPKQTSFLSTSRSAPNNASSPVPSEPLPSSISAPLLGITGEKNRREAEAVKKEAETYFEAITPWGLVSSGKTIFSNATEQPTASSTERQLVGCPPKRLKAESGEQVEIFESNPNLEASVVIYRMMEATKQEMERSLSQTMSIFSRQFLIEKEALESKIALQEQKSTQQQEKILEQEGKIQELAQIVIRTHCSNEELRSQVSAREQENKQLNEELASQRRLVNDQGQIIHRLREAHLSATSAAAIREGSLNQELEILNQELENLRTRLTYQEEINTQQAASLRQERIASQERLNILEQVISQLKGDLNQYKIVLNQYHRQEEERIRGLEAYRAKLLQDLSQFRTLHRPHLLLLEEKLRNQKRSLEEQISSLQLQLSAASSRVAVEVSHANTPTSDWNGVLGIVTAGRCGDFNRRELFKAEREKIALSRKIEDLQAKMRPLEKSHTEILEKLERESTLQQRIATIDHEINKAKNNLQNKMNTLSLAGNK